MEDFKTRPIGEKFDYEGTTLEVVEKGDARCADCFFDDLIFCRFEEVVDITGYCSSSKREDKKEVIFNEAEP